MLPFPSACLWSAHSVVSSLQWVWSCFGEALCSVRSPPAEPVAPPSPWPEQDTQIQPQKIETHPKIPFFSRIILQGNTQHRFHVRPTLWVPCPDRSPSGFSAVWVPPAFGFLTGSAGLPDPPASQTLSSCLHSISLPALRRTAQTQKWQQQLSVIHVMEDPVMVPDESF